MVSAFCLFGPTLVGVVTARAQRVTEPPGATLVATAAALLATTLLGARDQLSRGRARGLRLGRGDSALSGEAGGAEGGEVFVVRDEGGEGFVEFHGAADAGGGLGELVELAGVAAEVELDGGVAGVPELGLPEDGLGGGDGVGAAGGVTPHDPPAGFAGLGDDEFGEHGLHLGPALLGLKDGAAQGEDLGGRLEFGREVGEFGGGVVGPLEREQAARVGDAPPVKHERGRFSGQSGARGGWSG